MPLTPGIAAEASEQYAREYDRYEKLARHVASICAELVSDAHIQATVQHRAKDPQSLRDKLFRYLNEGIESKIESVGSVRDSLEMVGDLAGVRVATYVEADCLRVVELIRTRFRGPEDDGSVEVDTKLKESGYRATHCQVLLPDEMLARADVRNIATTSAEIQVCSMLAHVWNEIEHDMRYKFDLGWGDEQSFRDQMLTQFHEAVDDGDGLIEQLLGLRSDRIADGMSTSMALRLPDLRDFDANGAGVLREFVRLGYTTPEAIAEEFLGEGWLERGRSLVGEINIAFAVASVDSALNLSPTDADVIFALLLQQHARDLVALYEKQLESEDALRTAKIAQAVLQSDVRL